MELNNFDVDQNEQQDFSPIPDGWYKVCIVKSEGKPTKAEGGMYINFQFQVLEGKYKNRTIFHVANWINKNETAQKIGRGQISSMSKAVGFGGKTVKTTTELHNLPLAILVGHEFNEYKQEEQNVIKKFLSVKDESVDFSSQPTGSTQTNSDKPSWQNTATKEDDVPF